MKKQEITYKFNNKYEMGELVIVPLENGKCEYKVDCHYYSSLESLVDRTLNKQQLDFYIENPHLLIGELKYE